MEAINNVSFTKQAYGNLPYSVKKPRPRDAAEEPKGLWPPCEQFGASGRVALSSANWVRLSYSKTNNSQRIAVGWRFNGSSKTRRFVLEALPAPPATAPQ
jgi:hypothetical protein